VLDSADKKLASFAGPVSDVGKELYVIECPCYIFFSLLLMKKPNKLALIPEKTSLVFASEGGAYVCGAHCK